MTNQDKINAINLRIELLKSRGETVNAHIINKLLRRRRKLEAQ